MRANDIQDPRCQAEKKSAEHSGNRKLFHSEVWKHWLSCSGNPTCCFGVRFRF